MESTPTAFVDSLRPAGSKRSGKRDFIVNVFLRQEGHLTADDLVALIRREDQRISRATVYRTLQWMVDAGIARKVDFGEGRFRFEHSYRHPRHFHLICKTCHRSFEFLSSDIEALHRGGRGRARHFTPRRASADSRHLRSVPHRAGRRRRRRARPSWCSRATRCASRLRPNAAASSSTRARRSMTKDARGRRVFQKLAEEEKEHLGTLEQRYRELLQRIRSSSRGRRFSSSRARRTACSPKAPTSSTQGRQRPAGAADRHPCERGSHKFFKRYGERFEDSEGKQIFLEFADEERTHLDLLIREYRLLVERQRQQRRRPAQAQGQGSARPPDAP